MKILSVFKTPLIKTPRPRRLLDALSQQHQVSYICPPEINEPSDERRHGYLYRQPQSRFVRWLSTIALKIGLSSLASRLESAKYVIPTIKDKDFDIIFVHDLYLLAKFSHLKETKLIFDAREYYPTEFAEDPNWANTTGRLAEYTCKKHMQHANEIMTVSPSLVELYKSLLDRPIKFFPSYPKANYLVKPKSNDLHTPVRFVHHGNAFANRGLERMIDLMTELGEGYQLDMMLVSAPGNRYFKQLQERVAATNNVNIIEPVHPDLITQVCSRYDYGLYLMSINESQNRFCLPNKYFEFLFSGLPVITSFSRDMKYITDKYKLGLGFLDESVGYIADQIRCLSHEDYIRFCQNIETHVAEWTIDNNIKSTFPELLQADD